MQISKTGIGGRKAFVNLNPQAGRHSSVQAFIRNKKSHPLLRPGWLLPDIILNFTGTKPVGSFSYFLGCLISASALAVKLFYDLYHVVCSTIEAAAKHQITSKEPA